MITYELGNQIPYWTKIRRTELSKFLLGVENFAQRKILSVENFVQCFNTKVGQESDKIVEISAWCRKFVQQNILSYENFV